MSRKRRTDRAGGSKKHDVVTIKGIWDCPRCGATLHTGDKKYRVGNREVCGVCAIMLKNS